MTQVKDKLKKRNHGKTLRVLRIATDLTQQVLGEMVGMNQKKIYQLETEEHIPKETLKIFSDFFGVSIDFFDKFNFEDAAKSILNTNNISNDSSSQNSFNTATEQEIIFNNESPKLYELYEARIRDAEELGRLKEQVKHLHAELALYKEK